MQNQCAEIKVRAERRAGELLGEMAEHGERDAGKGGDRRSGSNSHDVSLKDLSITHNQSSRWQAIAKGRPSAFSACASPATPAVASGGALGRIGFGIPQRHIFFNRGQVGQTPLVSLGTCQLAYRGLTPE